jgi:hypothetical protein
MVRVSAILFEVRSFVNICLLTLAFYEVDPKKHLEG